MIIAINLLKFSLACVFIIAVSISAGEKNSEERSSNVDKINTTKGDLMVTLVGHASLMFDFNGKILYIDPVMSEGDYNKMPKADIIIVTHEHGDHLDPFAINAVRTDATAIILTKRCSEKVEGGIIMYNGDTDTVKGLPIEAVPAYNIVNKRSNGQPFHPKGNGNGYIITFGDKKIYIAGDTENTPEMKALKNIYAAFLPMNLPYTMNPEMVADAVIAFKPVILYPYHRDDKLIEKLKNLLKKESIDIRIL
ncbi:MAG: MBL fold metallo-hydrolase [candidate division WOR-3 bacterium]